MINFTVVKKGAKPFLLSLFFISMSFFVVVIEKESIAAQEDSLYNKQNDQVAGITSLMSAVVSDDLDGVRFFSKSGTSLINQKNAGGATALHLACREKNLEMVDILIKSGADVNLTDREGWTPLMRASLAKDADIAALLLASGAKASAMNSIGESAIIHATSSDCAGCLTAIFEKLNANQEMDIKPLKQQLSDSFVIARNHDNQEIQTILENNLDESIKAASISADSPNADRNSRFKFLGANGEIVKESAASSSFSESDKDIVVQDLFSDSANSQTSKDSPKYTQSSNSKKSAVATDKKSGKKFKFNQGPAGAKNKEEIEKAKIAIKAEEESFERPLVEEKPQEKIVEEPKKFGFFGLFSKKKSEETKKDSSENYAAALEKVYSKENATTQQDVPSATSDLKNELGKKSGQTDAPSVNKDKAAKVFKFNPGPSSSAVKDSPAPKDKVAPTASAEKSQFKLTKVAEGDKVAEEEFEVQQADELVEDK